MKSIPDDGIVVVIGRDDEIMGMKSDERRRIRSSKRPFKGKRIEMASTAGVETFEDIAEDFMLNIFGFEPGHYLITDLSSLHDFAGVGDMEFADILAKIRDVYGLDVAELESGNLLDIFKRLCEQQLGQAPLP